VLNVRSTSDQTGPPPRRHDLALTQHSVRRPSHDQRGTTIAPPQHLTGEAAAAPGTDNRVVKTHRKGDNELDGRDVTMITTSRAHDVNVRSDDNVRVRCDLQTVWMP
jgi:hypothetical protein